jgi:hypothetical protein
MKLKYYDFYILCFIKIKIKYIVEDINIFYKRITFNPKKYQGHSEQDLIKRLTYGHEMVKRRKKPIHILCHNMSRRDQTWYDNYHEKEHRKFIKKQKIRNKLIKKYLNKGVN